MNSTIYVVDTNLIADLIRGHSAVAMNILAHHNDTKYLCQVVDFEVRRGFFHKHAPAQLSKYETRIRPKFQWLTLEDSDWLLAAQFWADTQSRGKQLSDIDLLLAAATMRLNATLVSSDSDFDALPVKRENWREA